MNDTTKESRETRKDSMQNQSPYARHILCLLVLSMSHTCSLERTMLLNTLHIKAKDDGLNGCGKRARRKFVSFCTIANSY